MLPVASLSLTARFLSSEDETAAYAYKKLVARTGPIHTNTAGVAVMESADRVNPRRWKGSLVLAKSLFKKKI